MSTRGFPRLRAQIRKLPSWPASHSGQGPRAHAFGPSLVGGARTEQVPQLRGPVPREADLAEGSKTELLLGPVLGLHSSFPVGFP